MYETIYTLKLGWLCHLCVTLLLCTQLRELQSAFCSLHRAPRALHTGQCSMDSASNSRPVLVVHTLGSRCINKASCTTHSSTDLLIIVASDVLVTTTQCYHNTSTLRKTSREVLIYRRRRCQEEAPHGRPAPERSRTCWHSWVWPGAGWSVDSPSSPGGAAQWCHYLTAPRAWAPVPPPPVDKMSPIPAPLADLEGDEMVGEWKEEWLEKRG